MVYRTENTEDLTKVDKFLSCSSHNNVFQSVFYYSLNSLSKISKPHYIVYEEDNTIKGVMLACVQNFFGSMLSRFASRSVIIGGPVVSGNDSETTRKILEYYNSKIPKEVIYTQIRNINDNDFCNDALRNAGYLYTDHLNYIIDLSQSEESIWGNIYSKRKNEIRRAYKEGVTVKEIDYDAEFDDSYKILSVVYSKARLPLPDKSYFVNAMNISRGIFRIFGAYYKNKIIGFMYLLCYGGRVYNWYAGSFNDYLKKYPNDVITWEVIRWAKQNGYGIFDFGGAGNPEKDYGVRDFKKKFGGREVNYGRLEFIHRPKMMKIARLGFGLWQGIRGGKS